MKLRIAMCAALLAIGTLASGCVPTHGVRTDEYIVTCPRTSNQCAEEATTVCGGGYDRVGDKSDNPAVSMLVKCRVPAAK
jgi:hypothetical protein